VPRPGTRAGSGHSHHQDGNPGEGLAHLKQALAIYQRIGTPAPGAFRKPSGNTRSNQYLHPAANKQSRHAGRPNVHQFVVAG